MPLDSLTAVLSLAVILEQSSKMTAQSQDGLALASLLQSVVAAVRDRLQSDRVLLYRFRVDQEAVVTFESVGAAVTPLLGQRLDDPCLSATWLARYQPGLTTTSAVRMRGNPWRCSKYEQ